MNHICMQALQHARGRTAKYKPALRAQRGWNAQLQCAWPHLTTAPLRLPHTPHRAPLRSDLTPARPSTAAHAPPGRTEVSGCQSAHTCNGSCCVSALQC